MRIFRSALLAATLSASALLMLAAPAVGKPSPARDDTTATAPAARTACWRAVPTLITRVNFAVIARVDVYNRDPDELRLVGMSASNYTQFDIKLPRQQALDFLESLQTC